MEKVIRIVICEDNDDVRGLLKLLIEEYGEKESKSLEIKCYKEGVEVLKEGRRYDILLLNVNKHGMNGIEIGQEVRRKNKRVKLIYITGCEEAVFSGFDLGKYIYLQKPFDINCFYRKIDEAIQEFGA